MKKKKLASRLLTSSITAAMMLQALPFASFGAVYAEAQAEEEALRNELLSYAEEFPEGAVAFYEEGTTICEGSEDQEITVVRLGDPSEAMSVDVKAYDVTAQYGTDYTLYVKQKLQKDYADDSQVAAPKVQTAMEDGSFQDLLTQEDATPEDVLNGEAVTPAEEQTPILEETSAEETSAEETPVEEAPAEETPAEETSAEEETTEDAEYEVIPAQVAETTETEQPSSEEEDGGSLRQAFREQTGKDTINTNWRGEYDQEQLEEAAKEADNQVVDSFDGALLTLDFAPGEYKKTLYIHIEDDDKAEITESTALILGNATSGLLGVNMQYTVNIEDNEEEQPVTFAMKDTEVITDRSASYAEITVERTTGLDYYANMTWRTASGTAESMNAYVPVNSGSVNFVPGQTEATIRVELTENAQIGTYFTVLIDQNMNIVEEDHAETIVWVGSKSANTDDLLETPDIFSRVKALPQPQTASTPATVLSEDAIDVSKYHTQVIGGNGWFSSSQVVDLPALPEKAYMKIDYSYLAGSDDTMSISFGNYEPFSKVQLKGNWGEVQNGSVFLDVSSFQKSDTLCFRTEKFFSSYVMIKSVTLYYTDSYTVITSQEQRNLDAYNYSSPIIKEPFKVAAIKDWQNSYAHETVTVASDGNPETFKNFTSRLEQGVYVDSLDVYAGSETENNYISDVMLIGADKDKEAREKVSQYTAQGWQFIDYNLNKDAGGHYIYLLYKTSPSYSDAIKDFVIRTGYKNWNNNYTHNGRTYNTAGYDGDKTFVNNHADLNEEAGAGSTYMYLYYTKQGGDGYGVTNIWFNETKSGGVKSTSGKEIDLNERGGGKYIYMHTSSEPSRCLGTVKFDGSITYNTIASLNSSGANARAISNAGGKFYVIPHYATRKAKVNFLAEEGSVVSFSGDKKGETGFQENRAFVCTQIDKVTITATDLTKGQNIYPSNILHSSYHSATVDGKQVRLKDDEHMLFAQDQTDTASLTKVVAIDYEEEDFTACYNRPAMTLQYDADELTGVPAKYLSPDFDMSKISDEAVLKEIGSPAYGQVMVSLSDDTSNILGTSNFNNPFTLSTDDLSLMRHAYLFNSALREDMLFYNDPKTGEPYRTITFWNYIDPKTGFYKTVKGNSFVFMPFYGQENVSYYFQTEQRNKVQVGVTGVVNTLEKPLFAADSVGIIKTPAVGVNLVVGGYDTKTAANGTFSVGKYFNKGDNISIFANYNSLTAMETVDVSKSSDTSGIEVNIDVNNTDKLRVTSSKMQKDRRINKAQFTGGLGLKQETYLHEDTVTMILEDANYYLTLAAEGDAGFIPKEAEFRVYSKSGDLKTEFTKRVAFDDKGALTYKLNPMSMGDGKHLEVGDTFTVTLYDREGAEYFEHHTEIIVAEKTEGMYMFNYDGWKSDSDNLFVKAMGNISYAYDFVLDSMMVDGIDYADANGRQHHTSSFGFGQNFFTPDAIHNNMQNSIKMIDQMVDGTYVPQYGDMIKAMGGSTLGADGQEDRLKTTGSTAWGLTVQVGMLLDCTLQNQGEYKGKYYFNDFLLIAACTVDFKKEWTIPVKAVDIKIGLGFNVSNLSDGSGSGVRWHFYRDPDATTPLYLTDNSTIQVLDWDGTKSKGVIGFNSKIGANVDVEVLGGIFSVGGAIDVQLQNYVTYGTDEGWDDLGVVYLNPNVHVGLTFIKIPLWNTVYRWDWGNDNITNNKPHPPTEAEIQEDILFTKTSDREIVDYNEIYSDRAWGGSTFLRYAPGKPSSAQDITEKILQTGFYEDSDINVTDLGNGKYLATFIDLVPGRETPDAFGAYYSVYNGSTWSEPQLLEDDGTADDVPTVCYAGSKGWLIVWSDASRLLNENENVGDILNTYDLTGRFFNPETNDLGDVMEITKTGGTDSVCDSSPEISYYEENGQEFMKIYYTKSEYNVSSEEDGEVIGDLLNPDEFKAVRNYDFENDTWADTYFGSVKEKLENTLGDGYDAYVEKWYGQEFLDLAPTLAVTEQTNEMGYWADETTATVAEADLSQAMAKDSAVTTYNHLSLQAYTLDKGGMAQEDHDENLYLQIYNYHDDEYHHPILISGKDADISDVQFVRMPVPTADGMEEATYLYWLEDSCIKRINISSLVKNSLVKGETADGQSYYYVDKSMGSGFEPEQILAEPTVKTDADGEETVDRSIHSFKVKQSGDYNYLMWTEAVQQETEDKEAAPRMEQQLFAMRENSAIGEMTYPVQITDETDLYLHRFDFVVAENGEMDVLADKMTLNAEGTPDKATSALTAYHIVPSDKLVISDVSDASIALNDDGDLAAQMDVTLENQNFNTQENVVVEVRNADGTVVYTSNAPLVTYEGTETAFDDGTVGFDSLTRVETENHLNMLGGQSTSVAVTLPTDRQGNYSGTVALLVNGTEVETQEISGQLRPELLAQNFTARASDRNEITLSGTISNTNYLPSDEETVTYGYVDSDGNQVELGTTTISPLEYNDEADFEITAEVDFDKFESAFGEDGSLIDTLNFYLACDDFTTATATATLTADAEEYELMTGLKNFDAKPSLYNLDGTVTEPETFQPGDKAYMNLWVADDFAQNQEDYVGRTKLVWTESTDDVASVTRDGIVTANGAGTTTLSGYIVPSDTEAILYNDGTSQTIDNYIYKPSAVVVPITATITVGDAEPTSEDDTTEPASEDDTTEPASENDNNNIASDGTICEWAVSDLEDKTGETVAATTLKIQDDGSYAITMMDENGEVLDEYVIDPTTGKGTNQAGENVNLPQTGNNSPTTLFGAVSAVLMMGLGWVAIRFSGIFRKKRETENDENLD